MRGRRASPLAGLLLGACLGAAEGPSPAPSEPVSVRAERGALRFAELAPGVWLHTSYKDIPPYGPFPSNGLLVARGADEAVLIDTAWTDAQTDEILSWSEAALGRRVTAAVVTHAHDDKMGGVGALRAAGIKTYAHPRSNTLAGSRALVPAEHDLVIGEDGDAAPHDALTGLTVHYPGPGHTEDNIVVAVNGTDVLFGGCLIRPGGTTSLGNTTDANLSRWADTVRAVARRFPDAAIVVPSHGPPGDRALLSQTVALAEAATTPEGGRAPDGGPS